MRKTDFVAYAEIKYLLQNPFKLRKVADVIRGKKADIALQILKTMPQRAAETLYKALYSAYSNAVNTKKIAGESLVIGSIMIDEGTRHKRFQARARGRGFQILKRSSHIKIGLIEQQGEKNGTKG